MGVRALVGRGQSLFGWQILFAKMVVGCLISV